MIINDFIVNLMSQHVVPFGITLLVLFIAVLEITYKNLVKNAVRRCDWVQFTIENKAKAFFSTIVIFSGLYIAGVIIELICYAIVPILITMGIAGVVLLFFYTNYLVAKKYAKKYEFEEGQKLIVSDVSGLVNSALVKTPRDSIVTCLGRIPGKQAYKVKTKKGKIAERKEWRLAEN